MRDYNKNAIMAEACRKIEELIAIEHPDKGITVRYVKIGAENYDTFSDFQKGYFRLRLGDEYILVEDEDEVVETILYAVCVTYDSMLTAVSEAMRLISMKF